MIVEITELQKDCLMDILIEKLKLKVEAEFKAFKEGYILLPAERVFNDAFKISFFTELTFYIREINPNRFNIDQVIRLITKEKILESIEAVTTSFDSINFSNGDAIEDLLELVIESDDF